MLVALEYNSTIDEQALCLTHDQVLDGAAVPPFPIALVRFDSIDHRNPNHPNAHLGATDASPLRVLKCDSIFQHPSHLTVS